MRQRFKEATRWGLAVSAEASGEFSHVLNTIHCYSGARQTDAVESTALLAYLCNLSPINIYSKICQDPLIKYGPIDVQGKVKEKNEEQFDKSSK